MSDARGSDRNWAVRYRPSRLDEVVGQDEAKNSIRGALLKHRESGKWLISGPHGNGKTTLARIMAKSLACHRPTGGGEACGNCPSCEAVARGNSLNYQEHDAASNNSVDDIRKISDEARSAPLGSSLARVVALDESHMLTRQAQNALLKILEEPPPQTHFMLITTDPEKLIATVRSRCIPIRLQNLGRSVLAGRLEEICKLEGVPFERPALDLIAAESKGHARDALSLAYQLSFTGGVTLAEVRKHLALDLDVVCGSLLTAIGEDWSRVAVEVGALLEIYGPNEVWGACSRVLKQAELYRKASALVRDTEVARPLADRWGARLTAASEWLLEHGDQFQVRGSADLVIALAGLQDRLGALTTGSAAGPAKKMGLSAREQQRLRGVSGGGGGGRILSEEEFVGGFGFDHAKGVALTALNRQAGG